MGQPWLLPLIHYIIETRSYKSATQSMKRLKLNILIPFAIGYLICTIFRSVNAVMGPVIIENLHLSNASLGLFTSSYVLAFAIAQIPLGILLDRFRPRLIQSLFFILGGIAIFLFGMSDNTFELTMSRALLGIGMSGGLMAAFKAITIWYDKDDIPKMNGIIMAFGGVGALIATAPTEFLLHHLSWQSVCYLLGIVTIFTAILIFVVTPSSNTNQQSEPLKIQLAEFVKIYKTPFFYRLSPMVVTVFGSFIAIQGLWAGTWLQNVVGLNDSASANILLVVAIAMIIGMFSGGLLSSIAKKLNHSLANFIAYIAILAIIVNILIFSRILQGNAIAWFAFGLLGQAIALSYAVLTQYFPMALSGRALTAINILIFLFAFACQYLIGVIIHLMTALTRNMTLASQTAFGIITLCEIGAVLWYYKKSNPNSTAD